MRYAKPTLPVFGGRPTALRTYHKAANPMYCLQHGLSMRYVTLGISPMTTYYVYAYSWLYGVRGVKGEKSRICQLSRIDGLCGYSDPSVLSRKVQSIFYNWTPRVNIHVRVPTSELKKHPTRLILKKKKNLWDADTTTSTLIPVPNSNPLRTGVSVTYPPLTIRKNYESAVARGSTPRFGIFQNHLLSSRPVNFFCFLFLLFIYFLPIPSIFTLADVAWIF